MNNELVIAILSTSIALAGLLLVFLGFIFSAYQSFPPDTILVILRPYKVSAWSAIIAFTLCIIDAILSLIWFLNSGNLLYCATIAMFFVVIIGVIFVAVVSFIMMIRR